MPAVPNVPGVPKLTSYLTGVFALLLSDVIRSLAGALIPQWGVYFNGVAVIASDSTVSFDFRQDYPISDYPVENGGFQSYNKVQLPADLRVKVSCGGSEARRQIFLASIDAVVNTTDLYDILTPEKVYLGYCFTHRDIRERRAGNVGLIVVDLWFTEIRETATATFTNTQQPPVAGTQAVGNVQPMTQTQFDQRFASGQWAVQ